jgi:hypothetical protein
LGGAYNTHEEDEKLRHNCDQNNLEKRDHWQDLRADGCVILKLNISKKWLGDMHYNQVLRIEPSGELL